MNIQSQTLVDEMVHLDLVEHPMKKLGLDLFDNLDLVDYLDLIDHLDLQGESKKR